MWAQVRVVCDTLDLRAFDLRVPRGALLLTPDRRQGATRPTPSPGCTPIERGVGRMRLQEGNCRSATYGQCLRLRPSRHLGPMSRQPVNTRTTTKAPED